MKMTLVEDLHSRADAVRNPPPWYHPRGLAERMHAIAFWCLILFLAGALAGIAVSFRYHSEELNKATQLGCLIHDGVTYELKRK